MTWTRFPARSREAPRSTPLIAVDQARGPGGFGYDPLFYYPPFGCTFGEVEGEAAQAHPILVGYLLSLLITFIGETLTMRLLHDIWPDLPGLDLNSLGKESK